MNLTNKLINVFCTICIFLCVPFSSKSQISFAYADSLFEQEKYTEAAIAYEYIVFSETDRLANTSALFKKAECNKLSSDYEKAINTLNRIVARGLSDSLHIELGYQKTLCYYLGRELDMAASELALLEAYYSTNPLLDKTLLLKVLVANETGDYGEAKAAAASFLNYAVTDSYIRDSINTLVSDWYETDNLPKQKSAEKARMWSTFLPGSGHIYAHKWGEGVLNAGAQLFFLSFAAWQIYTGFYVTAYFGGFAMFQRFYFGGIERAEWLTRAYNQNQLRRFNDEVTRMLIDLP